MVSAIQRVADIVSEISAATGEQSAGVGQVGRRSRSSIGPQQNSGLVEEMAAGQQPAPRPRDVEAVPSSSWGRSQGSAATGALSVNGFAIKLGAVRVKY